MTDFDNFVVNHPDAVVLSGDCATTSAVLTALDNATIVHLLAHGTHEPANAAFSRLELYDGGLVAHEIHTLAHPPEHVVLGACELAFRNIRRNDEPLGFAGALLSGGTRTVTASLARVGGRSASATLSDYHNALTAGLSPAAALATVTAADPFRRPFVCLGWGG
jgi:CHAT domain-containing protein